MDDLRKQNNELLNRLQSGDLHSFVAMQHQTNSNPQPSNYTYVPGTDAGEIAKLRQMQQQYGIEAVGIGETIYDDIESDFDLMSGLDWIKEDL